MLLAEISKSGYSKLKAGIVPYLKDGRALFFVSSNAAYGGSDPAISKGRVDKGESAKEAAVREGEEELGLRRSNMLGEPKLAWSGELTGLDATYPMQVYTVEVKDEDAFDTPGQETGDTVWMTAEQFAQHGRKSHRAIVAQIFKDLKTV